MADDTTRPTVESAGTAAQPIINITMPGPSAPAAPTQGLDTTVEGGAYRVGDQWLDGEGNPTSAPKGSR